MPTLDELREREANLDRQLAEIEAAEVRQREARIAEKERRLGAVTDDPRPDPGGTPFPPPNQTDMVLSGNEADLARWRQMIHRDTFGEQIDVTSREPNRALMAMIADAVARHARNLRAGRGDLGRGPASFYGGSRQ